MLNVKISNFLCYAAYTGRGITATIFPGCPETFQSFQQQYELQREEGGSQRQLFRDEHQKVHRFREGDVIALPAGVVNWCYNDGDTPVIAITVFDTSNSANQLDPRRRVSRKINPTLRYCVQSDLNYCSATNR